MREVLPNTSTHEFNFSDLRELVNFPCATIGVGDCEAKQSSWHKAFVLQECPLGGAT